MAKDDDKNKQKPDPKDDAEKKPVGKFGKPDAKDEGDPKSDKKPGFPPKGKDDSDAKSDKKPGFPAKGESDKKSPKVPGKKVKGPEITDKVKVDLEPEITREEIEYIFDGPVTASDLTEHRQFLDDFIAEVSQIDEILSIAGRFKRRAAMRRQRKRLKVSRERVTRHRANNQRIQKRARTGAINAMKTRIARKDIKDLPMSEKARIERMIERRRGVVDRIARRMVRTKRQLDTERLAGRH